MKELLPGDPPAAYRYFLPIQTRVADASGSHVSEMFYFYADAIANNYLLWHCGFGKEMRCRRLMVHTESNFRSSVNYPQVLLGALRIDKLGKSSLQYGVAVYAPKLDYQSRSPAEKSDILSALGITMHGRVGLESDVLEKISEHYNSEPSMFGNLVHVFCDLNNKPLNTLPEDVRGGMSKIAVKAPKL